MVMRRRRSDQRVAKGVSTQIEAISTSDADSMWNILASIIKDAGKDSLGVAIGTSKTYTTHKESWWLCEYVQSKVAVKQARFRELLSCREGNQEERFRAHERYREAKREAKKSVAQVKEKAYKKMDSKEGANDIFSIEKAREIRRDLGDICFIKDEGGDAQVCSNYRGIKLLSHTMKLWERVIERRLQRETMVSENQFGFMPGRSSIEAIHLIRSLMEKYKERQKDLHLAFTNLEKAYNSVPWELIWKTLIDKGSSRRYIKVIRDMYDGARTHVRTSIGNTEFFSVEVEQQGSVISPYLFALILDELSRKIQEDIL
ncbi:retrovirus-related pol polyprotein LINE-1 [Tanacetum coccineum]